MRIASRLRFAATISMGIALLMIASIVWTLGQVLHAEKARDLVHEILTVETERELARDDFIIRRESRAAKQWMDETAEFGRLLDRSAELLGSRRERFLLDEIRSAFESTKASFAALSRLGPVPKRTGDLIVSYNEVDAILIGQYLIRAYSVHDGVYRLRELESGVLDSAIERGNLIVFFVIIAGTLAMTINYSGLARLFAVRARQIQMGLAVIGSGDLDHRLEAKGGDEFAEIARSSNDMAVRLKASHASIVELRSEIARREAAEEQGRKILREKDILLRELFHRTRNNMQIIMAILDAEAGLSRNRQIDEIVGRTNGRIMSMALVHGILYESGSLSTIDLSDYCRDLLGLLSKDLVVGDKRIVIVPTFEAVSASVETAVPFGLVFHELVSNAMRHAYPGPAVGEIRLGLRKKASGAIELDVADDGVGLPAAIESRLEETLGLQLVHTLVEGQLHGRLWFENDAGLHWHASFEDGREASSRG